MFKIFDGRQEFYQWDLNQRLIIEDPSITQVHFCNKTDDCALVCEVYEENNLRLVNVPNILLQETWRVKVWAYCKDYTKHEETFRVNSRTKPADYAYTETEVLNWNAINEKVETAIEEMSAAEAEREAAETKREEIYNVMLSDIEKAEAVTEQAETAVSMAGIATTNASDAADRANAAVDNMTKTFSNALVGSATGEIIRIDDASPLEETLTLKISGENIDLSTVKVKTQGKNLIPFPYAQNTLTSHGITFTVNEDQSITVNGTSTAYAAFSLCNYNHIELKDGITYSFASNCTDPERRKHLLLSYNNEAGTKVWVNEIVGKITWKAGYSKPSFYFQLNQGTVANNITMYPQIEVSEAPTAYEPSVKPTTYPVAADGSVNVVPATTIYTDTTGAIIETQYNRDINKAFAELQQAIISLGGNV